MDVPSARSDRLKLSKALDGNSCTGDKLTPHFITVASNPEADRYKEERRATIRDGTIAALLVADAFSFAAVNTWEKSRSAVSGHGSRTNPSI